MTLQVPSRQNSKCLSIGGTALIIHLCFCAVFGLNAHAATLFEYYAEDWSGPNNSWSSRIGTQSLFYDTFETSAPQKGSSTIAGVAVATAVFDGNDFFTSPFVTGRPWAGLNQFSLSLVLKSNAPGAQAQTDINAFWNHRGILGFERGGTGQGEFAVGLYNDGSPNGAVAASTGLGIGDNGTTAGNINDNIWHTLTMVLRNETGGFFSQTVYVDGNVAGTSLQEYGALGVLADDSFSLGAIRGSASAEKFVGEVAALRFDDVALTASQISGLHLDYLGVIPEPSTSLLLGMGVLTLLVARSRQRRSVPKQTMGNRRSALGWGFFSNVRTWIVLLLVLAAPLQGGTVFEWFASDWPGAKSSWLSRTGGQSLFYDTYEGSAPLLGEDTLSGVAIKAAVFNGKDFLTTPLEQTDRPWAGISEFSVTVVFRSKTPPAGASTDLHAFYDYKGIMGFEVGGVGSGDFGIGIWNDGTKTGEVAAGVGLPSDVAISAGELNDDAWHIVSLVMARQGKDTFALSVYADGRLVRTETRVAGTSGQNATSLADQPFSIGTIRGGKNSPFTGSIAAVRLDTTPLPATEIEKLHRNYLGLKK